MNPVRPPKPYSSCAELAVELAPYCGEGTCSMGVRLVARWLQEVGALGTTEFLEAIAVEPPTTGSSRWDALLAGVVEQACLRRAVRSPEWAFAPSRLLPTWWFLSRHVSLHPSAFVESPAALANRGVFVHADELKSV